MNAFRELIKRRVLIMDGAMGTLLLKEGINPSDCFENLNVIQPELIEQLHRAYVKAGADIIETNTFGANRYKLGEYGLAADVRKIILSAVQIAKIVRETEGSEVLIAGSMGPIGRLIEPLGDLSFDAAVDIYKEMALAFAEGGADLVCIETISDIQEARAAVIAVKSNTALPIITSMTYDDGSRTVTGTTPEVASIVLEALSVDVIGANCSGGPKEMLDTIIKYSDSTNKPILAMPNAGLPSLDEKGDAVYKMTPKEFAAFGRRFVSLGANIVGGCCGTTPEHIAALAAAIKGKHAKPRKKLFPVRFASRTRAVEVDPRKLLVIGEKINPSGNGDLRREVELGRTVLIREMAKNEAKGGADLLDVNISSGGDDVTFMKHAVNSIIAVTDLPLSIDSANHRVIEEGLKSFPGKALINSMSGKQKDIAAILPMAKKYGAAVIALALDEKGVPDKPQVKLKIAKHILDAAELAGFPKEEIFIDPLVMTIGANKLAPALTLEAMKLIAKKLKVKTVMGVSNVSHGLPERRGLNQTYLYMAMKAGLSAAIMDPLDKASMDIARKRASPKIRDIKKIRIAGKAKKEAAIKGKKEVITKANILVKLKTAVIEGGSDHSAELVKKAIEFKLDAQKVIDTALIPGMELVGKRFSSGEYFLPEVVASAAAMKAGFDAAKKHLKKGGKKHIGTVVIATVQGDIHDIGKNIVTMLLVNHGFKVVDLGKDVPAAAIVEAAIREKADVVALSALLTTTMQEMKAVKEALEKARYFIPVMVGGAAVTSGYAGKIGANYSKDAVSAVSLAKAIIKKAKKKR